MMPRAYTKQLTMLIQGGLLVLLAVMPFHAFLSVWLGSLTGHQSFIQAWKEILLVILGLAGLALAATDQSARDRLARRPIALIATLIGISLIVTAGTHPSFTAVIYGAKTDLEFLIAFGLALMVADATFIQHSIRTLLAAASGVVMFGVAQSTILPADFLTQFGYGPATIPPNLVLDPAVKSLRFASTLGGPNQLGTYLMLPLALATIVAFRQRGQNWWWLVLVAGGLYVELHTYSRSAWLGVLGAGVTVILILTPARLKALAVGAILFVAGLGGWIIALLLQNAKDLQYYILHTNALWHGQRGSDFEHLASLQAGLNQTLSAPLGHGLGTAGPATFHTGHTTIIENNYLQLSYETGIAGLFAFVALVGTVIGELLRRARHSELAAATAAAIIGVSLTALVLPAWTDTTTALTVWISAGAALAIKPERKHV